MYEKLSQDIILSCQEKQQPLPNDKIYLKDILSFYETEIIPFNYTYKCEYNLTICFNFSKDNLCHLLFGTIDNPSWKKNYSGNKGYENIKSGNITLENLPLELKKKAINRAGSFILIKQLLEKPAIIHFNNVLVKNANIKTINTKIDAKYLLDKQLDDKNILHLFLKEVNAKKAILVPNSFFLNNKNNYIENQLPIRVLSCEIKSICENSSSNKKVI